MQSESVRMRCLKRTWHHVQVNLRERQGFIIHPFTVPISTSAAQLTVEHEGYMIEPAFDFKQRAGYISVAKDHKNKYALRGSYAFREVCSCCLVAHPFSERCFALA